MAQRTVRIDDLDGASEDARPVTFALEGVTYDIDLSEKHVALLREALSKFMDAGRARQKAKMEARPRLGREQLAAIREWGHANGYEFSDQGRIPNHVMEAWEKFGGSGKRGSGGSVSSKLFSSA